MASNSKSAVRKRGPGKPFKKGQSGNPSGRSKVLRKWQKELADCIRKDYPPEKITAMLGKFLLECDNQNTWLAAMRELIARGYGLPTQTIDTTDEDGNAQQIIFMIPDNGKVTQ